ncbi:hypothetical protein K491DRAFT_611401 [Lophiostoma macrostomum CBS 122681]|uniref:Zn(2)-C6 fungal-type domain-containing protein n=1 Tax=Lophiostoma macrostomum CBS 122681 TaxID=1314788 RepID=A0A6A6SQB2_9PLEO|nr:hypothetical protein K491DRAFT_611401 [Lophiostoma macrostomum CBS 122681]
MPRRKLGLRTYHHKTKDGCFNCKRRRVKCNMQTPTCANCIRRNETCEYLNAPNPRLQHRAIRSNYPGEAHYTSSPRPLSVTTRLVDGYVGPTSGTLETTLTFPSPLRRSLSSIFSHAWFPHDEAGLWIPVLETSARKYPYVQHSILALSSLIDVLDDCVNTGSASSRHPVTAYQHQIAASTMFRQVPPVVNDENWVAVLCFGASNVVFHFAVQQFRNAFGATSEFSIMETFLMLRSSMRLSKEFFPYLSSSKFWPFIAQRTRHSAVPLDPKIRTAIHRLALVVIRAVENDDTNAEVNRQAFWDLREWVFECQGQPRIFKHLLSWPAEVSDSYMSVLTEGDDVALLILIYWCAIVYLSPRKWHIINWAKRTATAAIGLLKADWEDLLEWPLENFATVPDLMPNPNPLLNPVLMENYFEIL